MFNKDIPNHPLRDILVEIPKIADERGVLSFIQEAPFPVERTFWIYDVPEGAERGGHAHRTCGELFFALRGEIDIELSYGNENVVVHLDRPNVGVIIRPKVWCRLYNFSKDFLGLCLASQKYHPEGYINSKEDYLKEF